MNGQCLLSCSLYINEWIGFDTALGSISAKHKLQILIEPTFIGFSNDLVQRFAAPYTTGPYLDRSLTKLETYFYHYFNTEPGPIFIETIPLSLWDDFDDMVTLTPFVKGEFTSEIGNVLFSNSLSYFVSRLNLVQLLVRQSCLGKWEDSLSRTRWRLTLIETRW